MEINMSEYLDNLGWKPELWTVLTAEQAAPFKKISGYQNNMYDSVKDPQGVKAYGKGAMIVKIEWYEKHKASVQTEEPKAEAPASIPPPPPAPTPASIPPPPPVAEAKPEASIPPPPPSVPEKLQEIADASPNVVIASMPKQEEKAGPNVGLRIAQLESVGWVKDGEFYVAKNGDKIKIDYLGTIDDAQFYKAMADANIKPEPKKEEEAPKPDGSKRIEILKNNGCEMREGGDKIVCPDGAAFTKGILAAMDSDEWMKLTVKYSAKAVRDMLLAKAEEDAAAHKAESDAKQKAIEDAEQAKKDSEAVLATRVKLFADKGYDIASDHIGFGGLKVNFKDIQSMTEEEFGKFYESAIKDHEPPTPKVEYVDIQQAAKEAAQKRDDAEIDKYEADKKADQEKADAARRGALYALGFVDAPGDAFWQSEINENISDTVIVDMSEDEFTDYLKLTDGKIQTARGRKSEEEPRKRSPRPEPELGEGSDMQPKIDVKEFDNEMTTGDTGGFFAILANLGFQQLNLSITKLDNGKLTLVVKPENFSGDPAYDEISPLTLTGTPAEFDEGFFEAVAKPMEEVAGLMSNAKHFLKDLKEKEKKTKAAEEKKKEIDKEVDKAKKYFDGLKPEDLKDDKKLAAAKKKWEKVIELDPDNKDAKAGLEKIEEAIKSNAETLNL